LKSNLGLQELQLFRYLTHKRTFFHIHA